MICASKSGDHLCALEKGHIGPHVAFPPDGTPRTAETWWSDPVKLPLRIVAAPCRRCVLWGWVSVALCVALLGLALMNAWNIHRWKSEHLHCYVEAK